MDRDSWILSYGLSKSYTDKIATTNISQITIVEQNGKTYINYPYSYIEGENIKENKENLVENVYDQNGNVVSRKIYLDTKLKTQGVVDEANLTRPLVYTIKVRYKLSEDG